MRYVKIGDKVKIKVDKDILDDSVVGKKYEAIHETIQTIERIAAFTGRTPSDAIYELYFVGLPTGYALYHRELVKISSKNLPVDIF